MQSGTEQSVDDQHIVRQFGWDKLVGNFRKTTLRQSNQPLFVFLAVRAQFVGGVEKIYLGFIPLFHQHTGYGQGIPSVVAGAGEYDDGDIPFPPGDDLECYRRGGPFHQVERGDGFVFYRVSV